MEWDLEAEEWSWRPESALEFYYIFTLMRSHWPKHNLRVILSCKGGLKEWSLFWAALCQADNQHSVTLTEKDVGESITICGRQRLHALLTRALYGLSRPAHFHEFEPL